jgi:hypothetical protein
MAGQKRAAEWQVQLAARDFGVCACLEDPIGSAHGSVLEGRGEWRWELVSPKVGIAFWADMDCPGLTSAPQVDNQSSVINTCAAVEVVVGDGRRQRATPSAPHGSWGLPLSPGARRIFPESPNKRHSVRLGRGSVYGLLWLWVAGVGG